VAGFESAIGVEPMNISFAERPLNPLGYADFLTINAAYIHEGMEIPSVNFYLQKGNKQKTPDKLPGVHGYKYFVNSIS
jgi:hypothetical protein